MPAHGKTSLFFILNLDKPLFQKDFVKSVYL